METTADLVDPLGYARGYVDLITGAQPAAGANFTATLEGRYQSRLRFALATLATGVAVANRWVELQVLDSDNNVWLRNGAGVFVTASSTVNFVWQAERGAGDWANSGADFTPVYCPLTDYFVEGSWKYRIAVGNIQAADQLSAIRLTFERFPTGPRGYPEGRVPFTGTARPR